MSNSESSWPFLHPSPAGLRLEVLVQPRASRSRLVGEHDGRLKIQLAAPPVDGEANSALTQFLAQLFGVARRDVTLLRGDSSRRKTIELSGVSLQAASAALEQAGLKD